jgi:hypothetical protein
MILRLCWHNGSFPYGVEWKIGDVLGIACNLDINRRSISFSMNGVWFEPIAFPNIQFSVGLTPALTVQGVQDGDTKSLSYTVNFGPNLRHLPESYNPVSDKIVSGILEFVDAPFDDSDKCDLLFSVESLPKFKPSMMRNISAQPEHKSLDQLLWVPTTIVSGHGQISIINPIVDNNSILVPTIVSTTGIDDLSYPSAVADRVSLQKGKWMYEVKIKKIMPQAVCSFGFANVSWNSPNWADTLGVGDDADSWSAFFKSNGNIYSKFNKELTNAGCPFVQIDEDLGICVSIGVDCDLKRTVISLNGGPVIVTLTDIDCFALIPAISIQGKFLR